MKHKRKLLVFFLSLLACLFLSACQSAKTPSKDTTQDSGSKDVKTYIQAMRDAKNMEYVSKIYRKNLLEVKGSQSLMYETTLRHGKIQFDPQVYNEFYTKDGGNGSTTDSDSDHFRSLANKIGSTGYGDTILRLYSPEKGVLYKKIKKGDDSWTWDRVEEVTEPALKYQNIKDPEVGRHELILKLYEKYADRFKKTIDGQYIYLEFKGDVKKDIDQIGEFQNTLLDSELYTKGKKEIQSVKLHIYLSMKKDSSNKEEKLVPSEARIQLDTKLKNDKGRTVNNEDHFEFTYRDINQIKEVKAPQDFNIVEN
jgi:lipoprotein